MSITEIINKLCGKIIPVGETNEDDVRFENIQNYYEILSHTISILRIASQYKDRQEYSMQKIGKECYDILKEYGLEVEDE